jgi:hypothetical protein
MNIGSCCIMHHLIAHWFGRTHRIPTTANEKERNDVTFFAKIILLYAGNFISSKRKNNDADVLNEP